MYDIVFEFTRLLMLLWVIVLLFKSHGKEGIGDLDGWKEISWGFRLLFLASALDVTDNFPELNFLVVVGDTSVQAFLEKVVGYLCGFILIGVGLRKWLPALKDEREQLDKTLCDAKIEIEMMTKLLPVCASCHKIQDQDNNEWVEMESYIAQNSDAAFTHGVCDECVKALYPDFYAKKQAELND